MKRMRVNSTNIYAIGYDKQNCILEIEFNDGSVYQYDYVPESAYLGLLRAQSVGKFFHNYIKPYYDCAKLK